MTRASLLLATVILVVGSVACGGRSGCPNPGVGASSSASGGSSGAAQSTGACTSGPGTASGTPAAFEYFTTNLGMGALIVNTSGDFGQLATFTSPSLPLGAVFGGMQIVQKKWLYLAGQQMRAFSIDSKTGALTALADGPFSVSSTEVASLAADPLGKFLFLCSANNDLVEVFSINQTNGDLTEVGTFATSGFSGQATTDGLGKYLYVTAGNLGGTVDVYTIGASGALTPISGSPFFISIATLRSEPTGKFLLGVTGNGANNGFGSDNHIYVFSIDPLTGAPSLNGSPFATTFIPGDLAVHPNGTFVYTFNPGTSPVEGFQLNASGALTSLSTSPFKSMTGVISGLFDQSGVYLFLHSPTSISLAAVDTKAGTLTSVGSPVSIGSSTASAVTDP